MASRSRPQRRPWWHDWRPGRRAEALLIALLIHGLMALTLAVGYRAYLAGLAARSQSGQAVAWLVGPGEAGLALLLGLAIGGWLAGVWLGERLRWDWAWVGLIAALLSLPVTDRLLAALEVTAQTERFALADLTPQEFWLAGLGAAVAGLFLGGLVGAWWSGLAPTDETEEE
jgi:hypothetical protein